MVAIYLAGPMTADTSWLWEQNIRSAEAVYFELIQRGYAVHCPHTQGRYFRDCISWEVALDADKEMLRRCDAVFVLPGWEKSKGTLEELRYSREIGVPYFHDLDTLEEFRNGR